MSDPTWNAQATRPLRHDPVHPGQVFAKGELPDPGVQAPAGIDPEGWLLASPTSLFVEGDPALGLSAGREYVVEAPKRKSTKA